jgi:hypothetical protein
MSLAAALRALAQGFEAAAAVAEADEAHTNESSAPAKPGRKPKAAAAAPEPAQPAAAQPSTVATAPAPVQSAPPPAAPSISKEKLNKAVLAVAGVNREAAIAILAKFGVANTATLPVEKYQEVYDAFEEKKAQLDAASVQASLV